MKDLSEHSKPATWYIVRKAMEMTLKEVRVPKCIRDGKVKLKQ